MLSYLSSGIQRRAASIQRLSCMYFTFLDRECSASLGFSFVKVSEGDSGKR
jgi:hypothetical protein